MNPVPDLIAAQRRFFATHRTLDTGFRRDSLRKLGAGILAAEGEILEALKSDLGKPAFESWGSEIGPVLREISFASRKLSSWAKPRRVPTPLLMFPGRSVVRPEPYGVCAILAPWNYPVHLTLMPLASALAAGNCAVIKSSELAPATARILASLVARTFDPGHVAVVEGDAETASALMREKWDYIFFSGSTSVGRLVMAAAAKNLTPLTLELGGKCPVIVDEDADIGVAARRVAWGKFYNAGQTCVAPDYALVADGVKDRFVASLREEVTSFFGSDPSSSPDYARIVNARHFARLSALMREGHAVVGGETREALRYIAPTVLDGVPRDGALMRDEIFGPLLPVIPFRNLDEAVAFVNSMPRPLTLYFFSSSGGKKRKVLREIRSGGAVMNDAIIHMANPRLPFGGSGSSGFGRYHGRAGFDAFSQSRSVLFRPFRPDFKFRYPPYKLPLKWLKKLF